MELPDTGRFCPKCGTPVRGGNQIQGTFIDASNKALNAVSGAMDAVPESRKMIPVAEGVLSVVLALLVLCAPVIRVNLYYFGSSISMLTLFFSLARFGDYLGEYAIFLLLIAFLMIAAFLSAAINALRCFKHRGAWTKDIRIAQGVRVSSSACGGVAGYALCLLILLWLASHDSYGIVGATGWVWFLLFAGLVNMLLDHLWKNNSANVTQV